MMSRPMEGSRSDLAWIVLVACCLILLSACNRPSQVSRAPIPPPAITANQKTLSGRVVRVADGDTITVLDSANTQHRIRLQGIDAPESHQDFGTRSKKNLSDLIFSQEVTVAYDKTDRYGRLIGTIWRDGRDINLEQIRAGMAWHYKDYEREQSPEDRELYARAESEARSARRGLWVDVNPVEPSQFRKEERRERKNGR